MEAIDKINKIKELIQDDRITIEKKTFKSYNSSDPIKGTMRTIPERTVENCILLKSNGVTHSITIPWSVFEANRIAKCINLEVRRFNERYSCDIKKLFTDPVELGVR